MRRVVEHGATKFDVGFRDHNALFSVRVHRDRAEHRRTVET